jgi:hypothetical protein
VQFHIEYYPGLRNVQLIALGAPQNLDGWRRLERALAEALATTRVQVNTHGLSLLFFALVMGGMVAYALLSGKQEIAQALRDMLRM